MADEKQPAPDGLSLVIDYVNTRDREAGSDDIGSPRDSGNGCTDTDCWTPGGLGAGRG